MYIIYTLFIKMIAGFIVYNLILTGNNQIALLGGVLGVLLVEIQLTKHELKE